MKRFNSLFFKSLIMIVVILLFAGSLIAESQKLSADGNKNLRSANIHLNGGRYEKALPLFKAVLLENPHHIISLQNIAGIYYDIIHDYVEANSYYNQAIIEINNFFAEYEELLKTDEKAAKKFYKKHIKKEKLEDKLEQITKLKASCWTKQFLSAQDKFKNEDYDGSIDEFSVLYEMAPDSSKTVKMLAYAYTKKGDTEKSLEFMIKTTELEPEDDMVRTQIANTYFGMEDFEKAIEWYKKASEINPLNLDNFYNLAITYSRLDNPEQAYESFKKVLEIEPDNIDAILSAYGYAAQLNLIDEAISYLKRAHELEPERTDILSDLCFYLSNSQKFEDLLIYAAKWHELDKESQDAQLLLNLAKQKLNK